MLGYAVDHGKFESTYLLYESGVRMDKNDPAFHNILDGPREQGHAQIVEPLIVAEQQRIG